MAQTAAWLPLSASPEARSDQLGMNTDNPQQQNQAPNRAHPAPVDLTRWELAEILKSSTVNRVDASSSASGHNGYSHPSSFDQSMSIDPMGSSSHPGGAIGMHFSESDKIDVAEQSPYDIFSNAPPNYSTQQRFRSNTSPAAPGFGLGGDNLYSHSTYGDSLPSFSSQGSAGYDMMSNMSSSYSSGKATPLTPNDPLGGMQHSPFGNNGSNGIKSDFTSSHNFPDLIADRRLSTHSYQSDMQDDFGLGPSLNYNGGGLSSFQERIGPRYAADPMFSQSPSSQLHPHHGHSPEMLRGVAPQATHFRPEGASSYEEGMAPFLVPNPQADLSLHVPVLSGLHLQSPNGMAATDLQTFIRPYLDQYVRTPNRLAFGERTVIVMSSKVAQKSYGTEKRFLCPPPTAIMIGNSWWSDVVRRGEEPKLSPPRVVVSISGEPAPQEGSVEWAAALGKAFDPSDPPTGTTYVGRCVGKQLFISDVDEKKKKVEALVKIMAPAADDEPERVIGTFPSRPIKVISKPSKKRQSAKNLELCINHGSTISLFHRLRSQTVSTKYLCVSGSGSSFKGSDGAPLMGVDQRSRTSTPSFIARTSSWDPFVMYIVDVEKPAGGIDAPPPPPPQPDYPSPPPNAISFMNNGSPIPIYYNQTVVLQCLTSGVVSPVLIIRKVDHQTTVVGGGAQEGAKGVGEQYCAVGEVCGDPVSQLHKVAFEVYEPGKGAPEPGTPGASGMFLSCMGEKVNTYRAPEGRQWASGVEVRGSDSPVLPSSPNASTPTSSTGSASAANDYFGHAPVGSADSAPASPVPNPLDFPSNDGGRVKKGKRSTASAGGAKGGASAKTRRRPASAGAGSSRQSGSDGGASSGALWQVDIGETSVWTIVGTDQVRYNFYVPPMLFDNQNAPQTGSFPIPSKPVTPFPGVVKYLPPDRAAEAPKGHGTRHVLAKPTAQTAKMLTLYGENFNKADGLSVFFGAEPAPYVEVRCSEVLGCLPPETAPTKRRPIILVRQDGVVFPSSTLYP